MAADFASRASRNSVTSSFVSHTIVKEFIPLLYDYRTCTRQLFAVSIGIPNSSLKLVTHSEAIFFDFMLDKHSIKHFYSGYFTLILPAHTSKHNTQIFSNPNSGSRASKITNLPGVRG